MRKPGPDLKALIAHELIANPPPKLIQRMVLHPLPQLSFDLENAGWQPHIEILDANGLLFPDPKPIRYWAFFEGKYDITDVDLSLVS